MTHFPAHFKFDTSINVGNERIKVEVSGVFEAPWQFVSSTVEREDTGEDITGRLTNNQTCLVDEIGSDKWGEYEEGIIEARAEARMDR